jgi:hypothetical protein
MAERRFTDRSGTEWRVYEVHAGPQDIEDAHGQRILFSESQHHLLFLSRGEQRVIEPIPTGWESLSTEALDELCGRGRRTVAGDTGEFDKP